MKTFLEKISYQFNNPKLLEEALTHPSFSKKNKNLNYQRLEFLGDTVLALIISENLMQKYPNDTEGELSRRRAHLVSGDILSSIGEKIGIGEVIKFSEGEKIIGGKVNKHNLENACEALIGAIYLDSDLEHCREFILSNWQNLIEQNIKAPKDPVSFLQEMIQSKSQKLPIYNIEKIGGNSHKPVFEAILRFDDKEYRSEGYSKKEAQKNAATLAVNDLDN
ncbi:MAG: ribonuclease-3 [Myxococcota bacterium]